MTRQLGAAGRATVLARSRVPVSLDKSTSLQVRNPGPPSVFSATASAPVAIAWADKEPACPASGMAVRTAGAVATGELVRLRLRRCDKTDLAGAVVALWAAPTARSPSSRSRRRPTPPPSCRCRRRSS